jgi:CRP-like cAMP-binding protein
LRIAQALISLQSQFGVNAGGFINIELSNQDLASFTGASYESLFHTINDLIAEKIIDISGKTVTIINEGRFRKLLEGS